jgi:predicted nucleic acid-binding protein
VSGLLLDTNVLSELRKGARANPHVRAWFAKVDDADLFTSVLVVGEIRRGIETLRRRDAASARALDRWLARIENAYADRLLPVDRNVAEDWGRLDAAFGLPAVDGLLAATARIHGLGLVTRNVKDVRRTGIKVINPFEAPRAASTRPRS